MWLKATECWHGRACMGVASSVGEGSASIRKKRLAPALQLYLACSRRLRWQPLPAHANIRLLSIACGPNLLPQRGRRRRFSCCTAAHLNTCLCFFITIPRQFRDNFPFCHCSSLPGKALDLKALLPDNRFISGTLYCPADTLPLCRYVVNMYNMYEHHTGQRVCRCVCVVCGVLCIVQAHATAHHPHTYHTVVKC